jgi:hypothetical protein
VSYGALLKPAACAADENVASAAPSSSATDHPMIEFFKTVPKWRTAINTRRSAK